MREWRASAEPQRWSNLSPAIRTGLCGRLVGLYGFPSDEAAFDFLGVDKQNALLLLIQRFETLRLLRTVIRIENVYGLGGVGFDFLATSDLEKTLGSSTGFTKLFARHRNNSIGFLERRRNSATLHLLKMNSEQDVWGAHFDLHSPIGSIGSSIKHLFHEKLLGKTPDWIEIARRV
ncbi:MAG: hypothetical protein QOH96_3163 [Blastocatellia bacterium]|nr:hypothetical protein [Blastocatellia bacterium]